MILPRRCVCVCCMCVSSRFCVLCATVSSGWPGTSPPVSLSLPASFSTCSRCWATGRIALLAFTRTAQSQLLLTQPPSPTHSPPSAQLPSCPVGDPIRGSRDPRNRDLWCETTNIGAAPLLRVLFSSSPGTVPCSTYWQPPLRGGTRRHQSGSIVQFTIVKYSKKKKNRVSHKRK